LHRIIALMVSSLAVTLVAGALAAPVQAAFPGPDGKIAFATDRDGNFEIYTINPDGSGLTRLTNTSSAEATPAWSPDGLKIAYARDSHVWTMNADGSGQTEGPPGDDPGWSPDGTKLIYARDGFDSQGGGVFVFDGTTETKVAPGERDSRWPEFSPDGQKIVFTAASVAGIFDIYTVNPDGTGLTKITNTGNDQEATWSPDGSRLAFMHLGDVWTMNPDGTGRTQVTNNPDQEMDPAWSPSGTRIALARRWNNVNWDLTVMNADGSGAVKVTDDTFVQFWPDWQPANSTYVRPKGATPVYASLVPAYKSCTSPNDTHGAPLAFPSCSPPVQASDYLTVGTPDANGQAANSVGSLVVKAVPGNGADVSVSVSVTDVRQKASLADYGGELQAVLPVRITDRNSPPPLNGTATVADTPLSATAPCAPTADTTVGSTCAITTSVNTITPGAVVEGKRAIWQLGDLELFDGGLDGLASTANDNTLFETQGVFVP
jgi:Tol biopolymer transport system component